MSIVDDPRSASTADEGGFFDGKLRRGVSSGPHDSHLPTLTPMDLPEALPLRRVIGPGVVLLALSIGSGEFVLWPFVASRAGMGLAWIALVGILTQYFVNMEIERYTLATGETAVTGFTRLWRHWAWLFLAFTAITWVWPGWAAGASTTAGFLFGWDSDTIDLVTVLGLVSIGVALTVSPVVYRFVERFQMLVVSLIVVFLLVAVFIATDVETWATMVTELGYRGHPDITPALLLGLLVFAGAGGTLNLTLSNWVRDKGMGMGAHVAGIESPLTGDPTAEPSLGHMLKDDDDNLFRWRRWWRVANAEQLIFFALLGFLIVAGLSALSASTVFGQELGRGFDFIRIEGEELGRRVGPWLRGGFWLAGAAVLFSTNLGILDHVGRVIADIAKTNWLRDSRFWSESKLYLIIVWTEIAIGSLVLLFAVRAPLTLMLVAASLNGIVMLVYSGLLIQLNRSVLPDAVRIRTWRLGAMAWAVALYGGFSFFVIWTGFVPGMFGSGGGG